MEKKQRDTIKVEVRKEIKKEIFKGKAIKPEDFIAFKMWSSRLNHIDDIQTQFKAQIRAKIENSILVNSPRWLEISELRRIENGNEDVKKQIQVIIKKVLADELKIEQSKVNDYITKLRDIEYSRDKSSQVFELFETETVKSLNLFLEEMPVYTGYMKDIKGLGVKTSAQIISILGDIERFQNPAKLWQYCGYGMNGDKIQKRTKGQMSNWSPKMRSLLYNMADCFIKLKSPYRKVYDERKAHTLKTHPEWTKGHADMDARRVMIKRFLSELFVAWYQSKGLEVHCLPYGVEIKGHHLEEQIVKYKTTAQL